jgi:alpha-L-fucosidase
MFKPTFDSLQTFKCPDWFRDAKFGIWSHWGAQSVPMYGDWYARFMYVEGHEQYLYHLRHYGHPSKFGYKDLVKLWKAENFNPAELMDLYYKAGARYFVAQAMHHDHFFNFPSSYNRFNSTKMGPMKDICGLWKKEADNFKMPFGFTEHLSATFSWWFTNKGADKYGPYAGVPYDGNDPEYSDFYLNNHEHIMDQQGFAQWHTLNEKHHEYWKNVITELIDLYKPDLLYTDGPLPFGKGGHQWNDDATKRGDPIYKNGLDIVAHLYNTSIEKFGENKAVYTQKDARPEICVIGVADIEKSQLPDINPNPWQTDTCIGNWFYDVRQKFKRPGHVIEMLVDIISKNGTMLLNILQLPDGSIDDESRYLLKELASWFDVNSEAVYDTRPWHTFGEGPSGVIIDGFREEEVDWTSSDYRFVTKNDGKILFAHMMRAPENRVAVIKSLTPNDKVINVSLLGVGKLEFNQFEGVLSVKLPANIPTCYVNCLKIELA